MNEPMLETPAPEVPAESAPAVAEPVPEPAPEPAARSDAEIAAELDGQTISLPDGDKMVPLSALQEARRQLRQSKTQGAAGADDLDRLRQQLTESERRYAEVAPLAEAFRALRDTAAQVPSPAPAPAAPVPPDPELEAIARDFDFYTPDGQLDTTKAQRVQARTQRAAEAMARQQVAPLHEQAMLQQAVRNLARAQATVHPVTKQPADPAVLDRLVETIKRQPNGLATLANEEAVKQLWLNAYALTTLAGPVAPAAPAAPTTPPVVTERSGGRAAVPGASMSARERAAARDAGLSEKEYLDLAKDMPAGWGTR